MPRSGRWSLKADSRAYGAPRSAPQAGDRFPWLELEVRGAIEDLYRTLDDTRITRVVIGQSAPRGAHALADLNMYTVADGERNREALAPARIPRPSFYLLRPDGHIGPCGIGLEPGAIERYVREKLKITS